MQRFHIDPAGNPGKCRARVKCPWGDLQNDHYPSERAARKAYELENTYEIRDIPAALGEALMEIGPRQLPNRMWIRLRNAIIDRSWSSYELELAEVVFKEEQESINKLLSRKPRENWSSEEQDAENILPFIMEAKVAMIHENSSKKDSIREQLAKDFPEDY